LPKLQKYNGLLLLNKPLGMTSHQAVGFLRRKLKMKQIGHAVILDPMATGLLILLVGYQTKISQHLVVANKKHQGTIKLGETSNTFDSEGTITIGLDPSHLTKSDIEKAAQSLTGLQLQLPPMFSAVKINGLPLYLAARAGKEVEREPREINVYEFLILKSNLPIIEFEINCSKGTYIRTLAHQMGEVLKCGGYLTSLHRTQSGDFNISQAISAEKLDTMEEKEIASLLLPYDHYIPKKITQQETM